ncbi:DUF1848 family protein [Caldicellulosiruptor bescii]|uniref:DUF1848 family protein n=1 Tax=Caldicellulosiruptor bescii TaxID=31899 RepID=UPI0001847A2D|nr:DUF1848 family protein [Caldicellulosiruptor bescii]
MNKVNAKDLSAEELYNVFSEIVKMGKEYSLSIEICAEELPVEELGLKKAQCVDGDLINELKREKGFRNNIKYKKDKNKRKECGCVQSVDVGMFNTCRHFCIYCYANHGRNSIVKTYKNMM